MAFWRGGSGGGGQSRETPGVCVRGVAAGRGESWSMPWCVCVCLCVVNIYIIHSLTHPPTHPPTHSVWVGGCMGEGGRGISSIHSLTHMLIPLSLP